MAHNQPIIPIPAKEASEEKKASLKDLLAKAVTPQPPQPSQPKIEPKQEPDESKTDSWQKRKNQKEVPEDVLRKILE